MSDSAHLDQASDPVGGDPTGAPADVRPGQRQAFEGFFERDALRERRRRGRHRMLLISLAVHVVALVTLAIVTFWNVDELWAPSVKVRVYTRGTLPAGTPVEMVAPPSGPSPRP